MSCHFFNLPLELRQRIYSYHFHPADCLTSFDNLKGNDSRQQPDGFPILRYYHGRYKFDFGIYLVCRRIKQEAEEVFRRQNILVTVRALHVILAPSLIYLIPLPLVAVLPHGTAVQHAALDIDVQARGTSILPYQGGERTMVILLEDLPTFIQIWRYSSRNVPNFNSYLSARFTLVNPSLRIDLQKRLLLPFGEIKGLSELLINNVERSVEQELRRSMDLPAPSPLQCLETSATLMEQGDLILASGDPHGAISKYMTAFDAIHILVRGRHRAVFSEEFFNRGRIYTGRFANQYTSYVWLLQRIRLVSCMVNALMHLQQWEDATTWGLRSVDLLSETSLTSVFPAIAEPLQAPAALLHIRTAIAVSKLRDQQDSDSSVTVTADLEARSGPRHNVDEMEVISLLMQADKILMARPFDIHGVDPAEEERQAKLVEGRNMMKEECERWGVVYHNHKDAGEVLYQAEALSEMEEEEWLDSHIVSGPTEGSNA